MHYLEMVQILVQYTIFAQNHCISGIKKCVQWEQSVKLNFYLFWHFFPKETFLKHKFSHMKCVVFHILTKYLSKDLWRVKNSMKIEPKIVFGEHVSNLLTQIKSRSWVSYLYDGWLK